MHSVIVRVAPALAVALLISSFEASANTRSRSWQDGRVATQEFSEPRTRAKAVSVPAVYAPGSIVIVNNERKLYYITGSGQALQYGVAVGKNSELWMGRTFVASKQVDPRWIPVDGSDPVEGGDPANPLGKRALYLDWSLLRIHGTPSRGSIGSAVSNGCIRMLNEDVTDLFDRVHLGAPVYAIKSWKEATRFDGVKVTDKIYVDPEAHRLAKEALQETIAENARIRAEEARFASESYSRPSSNRSAYQWQSAPSSRQYYRPPSWGSPFALGR